MTSPAFNTVLVRDSRLNDITDSLTVPVFQGASQNTYQKIAAETQSTSSIQFNVHPPSESIVIDRHMYIESTITFTLNIVFNANVPANTRCFHYGKTDAFQSFPLNKLFNTVSVQINNTNISLNQQDIIDMLLLTYDPEALSEYEGLSPYLRDQKYGVHTANSSNNNSSLGSDSASDLNGVSPRGSFRINSYTITRGDGDNTFLTGAAANEKTFDLVINATFIEPLFLSPFITCKKASKNEQGFLGVNNMSFVFNIDSTAKRVFSRVVNPTANSDSTVTITMSNPTNTFLHVNYLSTNALDKIKANNSIPYYDFPRYISANNPAILNGQTANYSSANIQLNQVPELIMIGVRKTMGSQTLYDAASFLTIDGININFNNASGLLSGASRSDLYYMSKSNGSKQTWAEWSDDIVNEALDDIFYTRIRPLGNVLFINPAKDLSLPPYLSNGSIGQYNLQFNLTVKNNTGSNINANTHDIVIVIMNGGMFSTFSGSSSSYVGLLNKELVLKTGGESEAVGSSSVEEMIGGNIANRVSSAIGGLLPRLGFRSMNKPMPNARSMNLPPSSNSKLDRFA